MKNTDLGAASHNPGLLHRLVVIGGTVGVAMLSFRVTRLFLAGLVVGLKSSKGKVGETPDP